MTERLAISRLGHRGDGIADTPAGQVFVSYTLPGETVTVEPVPGHPDRGHLLYVETTSPERVVPPCQHFGACGGCALQHWNLEKQLLWKRELVVEALRRVGLDPPVAATVDAHGEGRRRVTLHARRSPGGILEVGFAAPRAHHVVAIDRCPVLTRDLEGVIEAAWAIAEIMKPVGKPLDIQATATANGLDIDVRGSGPLDTRLRSALARLADAHSLARITRHGELVIQRVPPSLTVGPAAVTLPAGVFLQATAAAETTLFELVRAGVGRAKHVADLFCGIGPFALRLAQKSRVTAADSDAPAVAALKAAATNAPGLKPLDAVTRDLFRRPFVASELKIFDAVVFDPPRQGAEAQARELARSIVPKVVAVSCDSATFARDAHILVDGGYRLETVTPVDQFRYSAHIEIVGVFTKRDEKTRSVLSR